MPVTIPKTFEITIEIIGSDRAQSSRLTSKASPKRPNDVRFAYDLHEVERYSRTVMVDRSSQQQATRPIVSQHCVATVPATFAAIPTVSLMIDVANVSQHCVASRRKASGR